MFPRPPSRPVDNQDGAPVGTYAHCLPSEFAYANLGDYGFRCRVPGCSNRLWLHVHHVKFREHGGSHTEENLLTTCCVHHRLIHDGHLDVAGEHGSFRFTFPDGREVGVPARRAPLRVVRDGRSAPPPAAG